MRICLFTDVHWSQYSSIVRTRGEKYSTRLEYLIKSMNWVEQCGVDNDCTAYICLGDFFDKPILNSEEITALNDIVWSHHPHYFLVGNHEMASSSLEINSANILNLMPNATLIDTPTLICDSILAIPYELEINRKPLKDYFILGEVPKVIVSHNDIAGVQMGAFLSKEGFTVDEIEEYGVLFLNGHLHNESQFAENGYNIGNLCGQNFSEDAFNYKHCCWILDTDRFTITKFENPYALNFYKIDFVENDSIDYINEVSAKLRNAVCTIRCKQEDERYLKARFGTIPDDLFPHNCNIVNSKFLVEYDTLSNVEKADAPTLSVDHLKQFREYVLNEVGNDEITVSELNEVLK